MLLASVCNWIWNKNSSQPLNGKWDRWMNTNKNSPAKIYFLQTWGVYSRMKYISLHEFYLCGFQPQRCHYSEHTFEPHLDAHLRTVHTRLVINLLSGLNNVCFESTTAFHGWPKIYISDIEYHINVYMSLLWTECYYK